MSSLVEALRAPRVLMVAHPSVGHVTGLLTVGRHLQRLGAEVRFALPTIRLPTGAPLPSMLATALRTAADVVGAGLRLVRLTPDPRLAAFAVAMPWTSGATEIRLAARMATTGLPSLVRQLEGELAREPADVLVADFGFPAGGLVAERQGLPLVAFFHAGLPFPERGEYPFTGGADFSRLIDERLGVARRALGLPARPAGLLDRPYSPDLNLLATTPQLEGRTADYEHTHWVGPCIDGREEPGAASFPFARLRPDAVKVYVSLGTVFNGHPERFRVLVEGLRGPGVQLVVSAGASFRALASLAGPDVLIEPWVPQLAVLRAVDLVVSHGGNNTVNETLLAGRPLLVLPVGGEQEANARRVERLGAGLALDRAHLTPDAVRRSFERLRADASFADRARAIAASSRDAPGAAGAARLVLELIERRRGVA